MVAHEGHYGAGRPVSRTFAASCGIRAFTAACGDQGYLGEARSEASGKDFLKGGEGPFSRAIALLSVQPDRTLATAFDSSDRPARKQESSSTGPQRWPLDPRVCVARGDDDNPLQAWNSF